MVDILNSLFGIDISSLLFGVAIGLAPTIWVLIGRGVLFEYQEWRKRKQEKKEWYNKVERTANGIQRAWHFSGIRPKDEDRERTADEMDKLTDKLREYKKHQNATDEMVEVMNGIIERWDDSRGIILTPHSRQLYITRSGFLSNDAEELKELLDKERQGRIRKALSNIPAKIRGDIERVRRWRYQRRSSTMPYEIYREVSTYLSNTRISEFTEGDAFLRITREHGTDTVFYEKDADKYNVFQIDLDRDGELVVTDKLSEKSLTEDMLLDRLRAAETVDTIPYEDVIPNGQSLKEFEEGSKAN